MTTANVKIAERRQGVSFSKEISLGNIITIGALLVSVTLGYGRLDSRITVLESAEAMREKSMLVDSAERLRQTTEIKQDLREIRQDIKALSATVVRQK